MKLKMGKTVISKRLLISLLSAVIVCALLSIVQVKVSGLLLAERLIRYGGWIEVCLGGVYTAVVSYNMQDPLRSARWRRYTWLLFSVVFFSQLLLGLFADPLFLLSGDLHVPVPMAIIEGAVYKWQFGFMPILFTTTLFLSGPAWCSHLCYFGAFDNWAATHQPKVGKIGGKPIRYIILLFTVLGAFLARIAGASSVVMAYTALLFGCVGILIMIVYSRRRGVMAQCTRYCPLGALVSLTKRISPFRYEITDRCVACGACISHCRYGALSKQSVEQRKIGITCTYCGDCRAACRKGALRYRFFKLSAAQSAIWWLVITVSLHTVFLFIARV